MTAPLKLEIVAYAPTTFFHCRPCEVVLGEAGIGREIHQEQVSAGLPHELMEEYARVSDWVRRVAFEHGDRIELDLIDVASVRGFWKTLRHGIRSYPAVIVDGRVAASLDAAEAAIGERLSAATA